MLRIYAQFYVIRKKKSRKSMQFIWSDSSLCVAKTIIMNPIILPSTKLHI